MKVTNPDSAKWEINNRCNLKCPYCFVQDSRKELPFEKLCEVMDKLHSMNIDLVDFFGKEPLIDETVFRIMDYAVSKDYDFDTEFTFITNGINLEKYMEEIFDSPVDFFTVSYDPGGYSRSKLVDLSVLKSFEKDFRVEVTLDTYKRNMEDVIRIAPILVNEYGVKSVFVNPITAMWNNSNSDYVISESDYYYIINRIKEMVEESKLTFKIPFQFRNLTKIKEPRFFIEPTCTSGIDHLFVACDGEVYGCVSCAFCKGNDAHCNILDNDTASIFSKIRNVTGERVCLK